MTTPKILCWDIETNGVNARYADLGFIMSLCYKWVGDPKVYSLTLTPKEIMTKGGYKDKRILKEFSKIANTADYLVAHYGDKFDRPFFNGRLLKNKMPPIFETKQIDTCIVAWKKFKFQSNRLGGLASFLGLKNRKQEKGKGWPDWWHDSMQGCKKALNNIEKYCMQDVRTLEDVFLAMLPFLGVMNTKSEETCPMCKEKTLRKEGIRNTFSGQKQRYKCTACLSWCQQNIKDKK